MGSFDNNKKLVVGYARISQEDEDIQRQIGEIIAAGVEPHLIFRDDTQSGAKPPDRRPGYSQLLELVRAGMVKELYLTDLSRLGRDARGTLQELWSLQDRGIKIHSFSKLDQAVLEAPAEFQPMMHSAVLLGADLQRKKVIEDTKSGLARARAKGIQLGRPPIKIDQSKIDEFVIKGLSEHSAVLAAGYKTSTFYRWKKNQKKESLNVANHNL